MSTLENARAEDLREGDRLRYSDLDVTVTGPQESDPNQFGLPWFRYPVRADDGRTGYAKFGPGGHAARYLPDTITEFNAAQSAYFAEHPHDIAYPAWEDLGASEHDEHRATCDTGCSWCEEHRAWGECRSCGTDPVEANDEGLSPCCGSIVILHSPTEDNLAALRAA